MSHAGKAGVRRSVKVSFAVRTLENCVVYVENKRRASVITRGNSFVEHRFAITVKVSQTQASHRVSGGL